MKCIIDRFAEECIDVIVVFGVEVQGAYIF